MYINSSRGSLATRHVQGLKLVISWDAVRLVGGGEGERCAKNRSPKAPIEDDCYYMCGNPSSSRRLTKS